jgi:hypothetical protein
MLEYTNHEVGLFSRSEYETPYLPKERVEVLGKDAAIVATNGYELLLGDRGSPVGSSSYSWQGYWGSYLPSEHHTERPPVGLAVRGVVCHDAAHIGSRVHDRRRSGDGR